MEVTEVSVCVCGMCIYMYVLSLSFSLQDEEEEIILEVDVLRKVIIMDMVFFSMATVKACTLRDMCVCVCVCVHLFNYIVS